MRTKRQLIAVLPLAVLAAAGLLWLSDVGSPSPEANPRPETTIQYVPPAGPQPPKSAYAATRAAGTLREPGPVDSEPSGPLGAAPALSDSIVRGTVESTLGYVVEGERVQLYSPSLTRRYTAVSDEQGRFRLSGVQSAPDYGLSLSPKGMFKPYELNGLEIDGGQSALRIVLEPLRVGPLQGMIVNAQGRAVPEFDIQLRSLSPGRGIVNARSDSVGIFRIEEFPEGAFEASARGRILRIDGLRFDPDATEIVTLVVDDGPNQLSGQVYDGYGRPRDGVIVLLTWTHSQGDARSVMERRMLTDSWGAFAMDGLGKGPHDLVLATSRGLGLRRTVNIGEDPAELILYLE